MSNRHHPRQPLIVYLDVFEKETQRLLGYLGDISPAGLMFISQQPLNVDEKKHIYIGLPEEVEPPQKIIHVQIEVRWVKPNINPQLHCIGCYIIAINPTDLDLLTTVGEKIGFQRDLQITRTVSDKAY